MTDASSTRPRQVTMAGGFAVGGSVFLLFTVFETLGRLGSVQLREQVAEALDSGSAQALGISVDQAISAMRISLSVAAVCAAIAGVAGIFLFQRHHGARIALSVAAVPLLLTAPFTGGLLAIVVVAAAGLAWSGPARDWFAGRPVREVPSRRDPRSEERDEAPPPAAAERPLVSTSAPSQTPGPTQGYGAPVATTEHPDPTAPGGPWSSTPPVADRPPGAVRFACLLTWISSTVVAIAVLSLIVVYHLDRADLRPLIYREAGFDEQQVPPELLTPTLWITALLFSGWALAACVLAWFVRRRHDWARYLLIISAAVSGVLCLLTFPVGLPFAFAAGIAVGLLLRPESRAWFAGRTPGGQQPPRHQPPQRRDQPW